MEQLTEKERFLQHICSEQGETFQYNKEAILKDYRTQIENRSNLAIKLLTIVGGVAACLFFLIFLFITGIYDDPITLIILGTISIFIAVNIQKKHNTLIFSTISSAMYLIGYFMIAFSLYSEELNKSSISIVLMLIAIVVLCATQHFMLSFFSILLINKNLAFLLVSYSDDLIHLYIILQVIAFAYLLLYEAKFMVKNKKTSALYAPIRAGLLLSLLGGLYTVRILRLLTFTYDYFWLSSIAIIATILYVIHIINGYMEINTTKSKVIMYGLSGLILAMCITSPAILGALLIILLSFLVNYKTGFTVGIVSIIYFITQYYYDLSFTLLTKSILLFTSGLIFLLLYLFTKNISINEKK